MKHILNYTILEEAGFMPFLLNEDETVKMYINDGVPDDVVLTQLYSVPFWILKVIIGPVLWKGKIRNDRELKEMLDNYEDFKNGYHPALIV